MIIWNLFHARISSTHAILLLFLLHFFVFLVKEAVSENLEYSTCDMGYLNSVLSSSSQVHAADDSPVSGGGLRFVNGCFSLDLEIWLNGFVLSFVFYCLFVPMVLICCCDCILCCLLWLWLCGDSWCCEN